MIDFNKHMRTGSRALSSEEKSSPQRNVCYSSAVFPNWGQPVRKLREFRPRRTARAFALLILVLSCGFGFVQVLSAQSDPVLREIVDLRDPSVEVRLQAAIKLRDAKDSRAVEPLISSFNDINPGVRNNALLGLVAIGTPSIQPLMAALRSPDAKVRLTAVDAL